MTFIPSSDFFFEIAKGSVPGGIAIFRNGRNPNVGTVAEDIWEGGGVWVPPSQARIHDIVSTSANDTAAGSGARTVRISGLDASFLEISEVVSMNGLSNVATSNAYTIVHCIQIIVAGSLAINAGVITATAQVDGTVTDYMSVGQATSLSAFYQIPADKAGFLLSFVKSTNKSGGAPFNVDIIIKIKDFGEVFRSEYSHGLLSSGDSQHRHMYRCPLSLPSKSIIKVSATSSAANTDIFGGFELITITQ